MWGWGWLPTFLANDLRNFCSVAGAVWENAKTITVRIIISRTTLLTAAIGLVGGGFHRPSPFANNFAATNRAIKAGIEIPMATITSNRFSIIILFYFGAG